MEESYAVPRNMTGMHVVVLTGMTSAWLGGDPEEHQSEMCVFMCVSSFLQTSLSLPTMLEGLHGPGKVMGWE